MPILTEMITEPEGMNGWEAYCTYLVGTCSFRYSWNRTPTQEVIDRMAASDKCWGGTYEDLISQNITYTAEEGTERAALMADIQTYVQEMTNKFIIGPATLTGWEYLSFHLKGMGIDRVQKPPSSSHPLLLRFKPLIAVITLGVKKAPCT
jgi:hypothetical protein